MPKNALLKKVKIVERWRIRSWNSFRIGGWVGAQTSYRYHSCNLQAF